MEKYSEMKPELPLCEFPNGKYSRYNIKGWGQDKIQAYIINTVKQLSEDNYVMGGNVGFLYSRRPQFCQIKFVIKARNLAL